MISGTANHAHMVSYSLHGLAGVAHDFEGSEVSERGQLWLMMSNFTGNVVNAVTPESDSNSSDPASSSFGGSEPNDDGAGCDGLRMTAAGAGSPQSYNPYHGVELCSPDIAVTITAEAGRISARQVRVRIGFFAIAIYGGSRIWRNVRVDILSRLACT